MCNKMAIVTCLLIVSTTQAMDMHVEQGPRDPNIALILATISGPLDREALTDIDFLFNVGADPNYKSHLYDITPLMRAVRANEPDLVLLLLKRGAKVNVCNPDNRFVRDFNLIYDAKKITSLVRCITDHMLQIETHNAMRPEEYLDCAQELSKMGASHTLRKALLIDRILEDNMARSYVKNSNHPLLSALKDSRMKRALGYLLKDKLEYLPNNVWAIMTRQNYS